MIRLSNVMHCYIHAMKLKGNVSKSVLRASKVVCVAKNYSHLSSEKSTEIAFKEANASIFLKPPSALCSIYDRINLENRSDVVCETELALLITKRLNRGTTSEDDIIDAIGGVAIAFDLTRKDLQNALKAEGKPWELAKAFDNACPISEFIPLESHSDLLRNVNTSIKLYVNGRVILSQSVGDMILLPIELTKLISKHFTLCPGDVILTGTPTRPNEPPRLVSGDSLEASLGDIITSRTAVQ